MEIIILTLLIILLSTPFFIELSKNRIILEVDKINL